MDSTIAVKELSKAVELIKMLELITNSFASSNSPEMEVPWSGMQITLGQSKEIISKAIDSMASEECKKKTLDSKSEGIEKEEVVKKENSVFSSSSSLSDRIQQSPSTKGQNRVRELLTNVSTGSSPTLK